MILVRSPLRLTLGGGGTDLEPYCTERGGFCVAAAIDKYVYVSVSRPFTPGIYLKYSQIEHVEDIADVQHPLIRKALEVLDIAPQIEITTLADVPAGTGLGSSSSFATALLQALYAYKRRHITTRELAELAVNIERGPGRQDQYIAAYGGIAAMSFGVDTESIYTPVGTDAPTLNDRLLLFYTNTSRDATQALEGQGTYTGNLDMARASGHRMRRCLELNAFGQIGARLNEQWTCKEARCPSPRFISYLRDYALSQGATGVKLIGAGQGGFLLCDTIVPVQLRKAMADAGIEELRYRWDYEGTKVLLS